MYYVKKVVEVAMAHRLELDYESRCTGLHGHNAMVTVWCRSRELDRNGMVVDFAEVKRVVKKALDHKFVNEVVDFNPTAENLARWLCERIPNCYRVSIRESEHNEAVYERDGEE